MMQIALACDGVAYLVPAVRSTMFALNVILSAMDPFQASHMRGTECSALMPLDYALVHLAVAGEIVTLTADEIVEARDWLRDLVRANMDDDDFADLTAATGLTLEHAQIERAIERYYDGGIEAFKLAGGL